MENSSNIKEPSFKEKRLREILFIYYSRADVREAMFEFSKDREFVPSYMMQSFGKRPDMLQYPGDVLEQVKQGATSFHCSEEIWSDPLEISTDFSEQEYNELRTGWDLLLDIDSPYLEYSKIYADLIIKTLEFHGIKNIGVKFSVSGDTNILVKWNNQIKLIRMDNAVKLLKKGIKLEVLSLNKNQKLQFSKIYDYLEHEDMIYDIFHSQSKIPLKATGHHSVFIWNKGEIMQKKVTEIKEGDFLISFNTKKNPFVNKNLTEITNRFEFSKNQFSKKIIKNKVQLTPDLMRLIGYFLAEGHTTQTINQTGFTFHTNEKEYIQDVIDLLKKITQRKISIRHPNPNSTQILIHSKEWHNFFKNNCGEKKEKHIPPFAWTSSRELFLEMLKGYIRGDGSKLDEYEIAIKSVSMRLIKELVWLCKLNDISCSLSSEQNKPHKSSQGNYFKESFVYILKIPKSELSSLEFNRGRNKFSPFPRDRVFPVDGLKKVYEKIKPKMFNNHRAEQMTLKKKRANLNRIKKVLNWFENYKSIEYDNECKKIIENYEKLFSSDISVVEIKNILKKDKQKVYDISVEKTESFFGNDYPILLHNSGSKGFHIIVPWKAFPKEIYGQKTSDMFPQWPRLICQYLTDTIQQKLSDAIFKGNSLKELSEKTGKSEEDLMITECLSCHRSATKKDLVTWVCPECNQLGEIVRLEKTKRIPKCPECRKELLESSRKVISVCEFCELNSEKNEDMFGETRQKTETLIEADLILVASRHLFRMPYSLHEKTALSSIVIDQNKIREFQIQDANALKVSIKNFYPDSEPEEAKELLLQALDHDEQKQKQENVIKKSKQDLEVEQNLTNPNPQKPKKQGEYKQVQILNPSEDIFPPCIKKLLKGVKDDGRKRALFILINFFKSLGISETELEKRLDDWNQKNAKPIKIGYIRSQLNWYKKTGARLPPNCDKTHYRDLNICMPDALCKQIKNPLNYAVKKYFQMMK